MATMSKKFVDLLIAGGGWLPSEPDPDPANNTQAVRIVEYRDVSGELAYGVVFRGEPNPFRYERESQYIREPKVVWEAPSYTSIESSSL